MRNQKTETKNQNGASEKQQAHWGGVFAMTLCVFALIASEFMPVSLLTSMAQSLNVTGRAGDRYFRRVCGGDQPVYFPTGRHA